ncbi:MAG: dihydrodipicolinate synthase family protein, partial [Actinomycetota bacterium]
DDWATFGYVCLGAVGVISVASHLVGPQIRQMIELIQTGDVPAARKIHEDLSPLFNALFITSNPIPLKAALEMIGLPAGVPRLPLVPATTEERARVRKALEDAGLL